MTVAELANKLNATVPEIFEHYKKIFVDISEDENFDLSTELIKKAIPNYIPLENEKVNVELTDKTNNNNELKIKREKRVEILDKITPYLKKSDKELIQEFKKHNSIVNLFLEGEYRKARDGSFGFFYNVTLPDGENATYPISNDKVDGVFIATTLLKDGKRYIFEVNLANKLEREKHVNPFLLRAISNTIEEIEQITEIVKEINLRQSRLLEIKVYLETAEVQYEQKKVEVEKKVSKAFNEKQDEANKIIDSYNETISSKYQEIEIKNTELTSLNVKVKESNNNLVEMENLINTLKEKVNLCRNLEFISKDDENKYLFQLTGKEFRPINHLDFEIDFENNFSKLSEHIHAYLFYKKNLIYSQFQIRNFLTLLRTHDIIVLSGLSGSGKTQIVKAFAEALGGIAKIIPVKPNWTSSDDLIGYYNPLQMSFLPTPFTEAIVEAINNPNQLYFICLDEMNLARVEYYFADFLSKLEERSTQPEIELYAKHEEELFVSEFNTLLNLIETSISGKEIKSWQNFLDNDVARIHFFEMLGNIEKESTLQLHAKMKRRITDILKFPSTIKIPDNVRFIGAINVDETTHYFSPKILDRVHIVKFDNPLLFEEQVNNWFENIEIEKELIPVYVRPNLLSERKEYPKVNDIELSTITQKLKEINQKFLLPLNIDFGIRSIRQSMNYAELNKKTFDYGNDFGISLNTIILQKIFPRFIFDGSEIAKNGETKIKVVEELQEFLSKEFNEFYDTYESDETDIGKSCSEYLDDMIIQANRNNSQFNFFA